LGLDASEVLSRRGDRLLGLIQAALSLAQRPLGVLDAAPCLVKLNRCFRLDRDRNMPRSVRAPPSLRQRAERNLTLARERRNRDTAAIRVVNRAMHVPVHQNLNSLEIPGERRTS